MERKSNLHSPRLDDELHLTSAAQRVLGARLAAAMHGLMRRKCG